MLGCLCEKLDETEVRRGDQDALNALQKYVDGLSGGALDDLLAQRAAHPPAAQLEVVLELIVARISSDSNSRRFLECYREFMSGIQWTSKSTMDEIGSHYAEAYSQHYVPFMSRHEHILEHYLVNYAHRTLFPFGLPESNQRLYDQRVPSPFAAQYMLLIAHYAITKTLLIGMAGFHKSAFGVDHVIKLVQSCTKTFEHSTSVSRTGDQVACRQEHDQPNEPLCPDPELECGLRQETPSCAAVRRKNPSVIPAM